MRDSRSSALVLFAAVAFALPLFACDDDSSDTGTLQLQITDAPFPAGECVARALVTLSSASIKGDGGDDSFLDLPLDAADGPVVLDLLQLRNGIKRELGLTELPTGTYQEIRLVIDSATLEFVGGGSKEFKVPSGSASGLKIKIKPSLVLAANQTVPLLIDLDLSRSFKVGGSGGNPTCDDLRGEQAKASFSPVVRAINAASHGVLSGLVQDAAEAAVADVEVAAFLAGAVVADDSEPVAATLSSPDGLANAPLGSYALVLEPGSYDLYVRAQGSESRSVAATAVVIEAGKVASGHDLALP